jgi:hypothetical protein
MSGLLVEGLRAGLQRLMPVFMELAKAMADSFAGFMQMKAAIWETIGVTLAGAMVTGFLQAIMTELPKIRGAFNQIMEGLGLPETATLGEGLFKFKLPLRLPEGGSMEPMKTGTTEGQKTSILDSILGNFFKTQAMTKPTTPVKQGGTMMVDFGEGLQEVNLDALNRGSKDMTEVFRKVEKSSEIFASSVIEANSKAKSALDIAENAQRQIFQSNQKTKR